MRVVVWKSILVGGVVVDCGAMDWRVVVGENIVVDEGGLHL